MLDMPPLLGAWHTRRICRSMELNWPAVIAGFPWRWDIEAIWDRLMSGLGCLCGSSRGRPARSCSSNILSARPINGDVMFFYESTRRMAPAAVLILHLFADGNLITADVVTCWTMFPPWAWSWSLGNSILHGDGLRIGRSWDAWPSAATDRKGKLGRLMSRALHLRAASGVGFRRSVQRFSDYGCWGFSGTGLVSLLFCRRRVL